MRNPKAFSQNGLIYFCQHIFVYLKQYYKLSIPLIFCTLLIVACTATIPLITKMILDDALPNRDIHLFFVLLGILIVELLFISIASVASNALQASLGVKISSDLRMKMFKQIHHLSHSNYRTNTPGDLLQRFGENLGMITHVLTQVFWIFAGRSLFTITATVILLFLNWQLALIVFLSMALFFYAANRFSVLAEQQLGSKESEEAKLFDLTREDIYGHATVTLLRLKRYRVKRFSEQLLKFEKKGILYNLLISLTNTTIATSMILLRLIVIVLGSYWVFNGHFSLGSFFGFLTLYLTFTSAISAAAEAYPTLIQGANGMARVRELIDFPVSKEREKQLPDLDRFTHTIRFNDVNFAYTHNYHTGLHNINFEIVSGESVGIIGASGSGKSTLLSLLLRQEMPDTGRIEIDGKNIWEHSAISLLNQMGVVSRNPGIFQMSIFDNIRMGKLNATREEVIAAAKMAEIHNEIVALPNSYRTLVTQGGESFSAGQVQRIVLARALLSNPAILVLDEATSALDIHNQEAVHETLRRQAKDRTTVMVTHHLKEVIELEKIILIDKGEIVEVGNHDALIKAKGKYYQLWEKQSGVDIETNRAKIKLKWLRRISLFEKFDDKTLRFCVEQFMIEEVTPDQLVFEENTIGNKFYIIVTGSVLISKLTENGQRKEIAILEDGDFFGEIALLHSVPRTARATTIDNCCFLVLRKEQFSAVFDKLPEHIQEELNKVAQDRLGS